MPYNVATKESSCEKSQPSGHSKENLVVSTVKQRQLKKRLFHGTNLLALSGTLYVSVFLSEKKTRLEIVSFQIMHFLWKTPTKKFV